LNKIQEEKPNPFCNGFWRSVHGFISFVSDAMSIFIPCSLPETRAAMTSILLLEIPGDLFDRP
jgi:hypothetical protein